MLFGAAAADRQFVYTIKQLTTRVTISETFEFFEMTNEVQTNSARSLDISNESISITAAAAAEMAVRNRGEPAFFVGFRPLMHIACCRN